jgi:hypothetical protein
MGFQNELLGLVRFTLWAVDISPGRDMSPGGARVLDAMPLPSALVEILQKFNGPRRK